jgi:serine/threonine protein kinase
MHVAPVENEDPVLERLAEWEAERQAGRTLSPEELCPDDPELRSRVAARIARRAKMQAVFDLPTIGAEESAAPLANFPEVDGYEILEVIGHGGMGVVYKARQQGLNRLVALKMVLAGASASPQDLARFRAEAEAVAQLQHANIVQIFEIGEQGGCPYLALEYVDGGSLAEHLDGTPVAPRQAAELVLALARAVDHAHERGIVHRDLKPANVLLQADGTPKITDFGLAKRRESEQIHTQTGAILGSPSYMAPEQASGRASDIGPATDVYALGVVLYELLTGRPPFKGASVIETIEQVRENDPVPPRFLQPKTPRDLETICLKCLEKRPSRRYPSAAALAADLRAALDNEPIHAQSLTLLDQVARTISHHGFDARFQGIARRLLVIAPIPLALHLAAYLLFAGKTYYPQAMVATTATMMLTLIPVLLLTGLPTLRSVPKWQRRHFLTVWVGHLTAMAVILFVALVSTPANRPELLLMVYPLWAVTAATTFLAHATEAGVYYVVAALLFITAMGLALIPVWAPLAIAVIMSANMVFQGIYLQRSTRGAVPADERGGAAFSSTKRGS